MSLIHRLFDSDGVLSSRSGEIVVKPCKQSEIEFYETIKDHDDIAYYVPKYFGTLSLGDGAPAQAAGAIVLPAEISPELPSPATFAHASVIDRQWTPSNGGKIQTDSAVVLENVAVDFKKPNILDVKLGARLWADDAPPAKRARLDKAAEETTSKHLGFRIAGGKTYQGLNAHLSADVTAEGYRTFDKEYGRRLKVDTIRQGFEDYYLLHRGMKAKGALRKVIRRFVGDLEGMAAAIEKEESRMYSASLLFVFEGDEQALTDAFEREKVVLADMREQQAVTEDARTGHRSQDSDHGAEMSQAHDDNDDTDGDDGTGPRWPAIQALKLIDFAHAQWTPGQGPDQNILHGIRNVARILADLAG